MVRRLRKSTLKVIMAFISSLKRVLESYDLTTGVQLVRERYGERDSYQTLYVLRPRSRTSIRYRIHFVRDRGFRHRSGSFANRQTVHLQIFLPFLDDASQVAVFAARTPSATANAMHKSTPQTAITVSPRSNVDLLFHHVGFLKQNIEWSKRIFFSSRRTSLRDRFIVLLSACFITRNLRFTRFEINKPVNKVSQ